MSLNLIKTYVKKKSHMVRDTNKGLIEAGYKIRDTFLLDDIRYMVYYNDITDDNVIVKE